MSHVKMAENGRLVIPAGIRAEVGFPQGGSFVVSVIDGKIVLEPYRAVLERVWAEVHRHVPPGTLLSEELIRERREEAARD